MKVRSFLVAVIAVILFAATNLCSAAYDFVDLGTLSGDIDEQSRAYSINNNGQIVGYVTWEAVLFDATGNGNNIGLGFLATGDPTYDSFAHSINNGGQIVGEADAHWSDYATLFDPTGNGNNTNLGALGAQMDDGDDLGVARSINDNGMIVGSADISKPSNYEHAAIFDPTGNGNNTDLGTLGGMNSRALSVNNNGVIVGFAQNSSNNYHATLFDPTGNGNNIDLGVLGTAFYGNTYSIAYSVNDNGDIVGTAKDYVLGYSHAVIFDSTGNQANIDLGTLGGTNSNAFSINENGDIVGQAQDEFGNYRATLFDPTGDGNNIDLNYLTNLPLDWELTGAYCINENGWIVGYGINPEGYERAFLLIPEPAPPVADAGTNQTVTDTDDNGSEEVTLDGSGSSDSDGTIVSWVWIDDLGDVIPDGEVTTATLSVGVHTITLTVTDDDGLTDTNMATITIEPYPSEPPDANADGPYTICVSDTLTLDANGSTDEDNDIVSYMWDLDDNGSFETDAGGRAILDVNYSCLESLGLLVDNTYNIHLQVTDSEGQSDVNDSTLTILPKPATVVAVDIKPGSCPNPVNVKGSGVLPVAILGTVDYDVNAIDPTSIRLGGVEPLRSGYEDVATPMAGPDNTGVVLNERHIAAEMIPVELERVNIDPASILVKDSNGLFFQEGEDYRIRESGGRVLLEIITVGSVDPPHFTEGHEFFVDYAYFTCDCSTVGPDGFMDLTLKFRTQDIVEATGEVNDGDVLPLELTGVLFGERPIEGADCIRIRGRYKPFNKADTNRDGVVDLRDFAGFAENWLQSSIVED
jgi:probable HAF family extracellular repeat protein